MRLAAGVVLAPWWSMGALAESLPVDQLPAELPAATAAQVTIQRSWSVKDIIEIREITAVAVEESTGEVAFIVKEGSVATGGVRYGLYVLDDHPGAHPRKVVETAYLGELSWHPGTLRWTVLGQFDGAVQLYDIDDQGQRTALVVNPDPELSGAYEGVISSATEAPRMTGVISYEWAPDGSALWYSRMRTADPIERHSEAERGLVYDEAAMNMLIFRRDERVLLGKELRVFLPESRQDRMLAFAPSEGIPDQLYFNRELGTAAWLADSRHLRYSLSNAEPDVPLTTMLTTQAWIADVKAGTSSRDSVHDPLMDANESVPVGGAGDVLKVEQQGAQRVLRRYAADRTVKKDYGAVAFRRFATGEAAWEDHRGNVILAVHYRDHDGVAVFPQGSAAAALLAANNDNLSHCALSRKRDRAICVRENLVVAPELVSISLTSGTAVALARPNTRYDEIEPLRSEHTVWRNRYGNESDGFITYPRGYQPGKKYPVILVTHASDARNLFAYFGFQWEFPVQVFAEQGYVVLSVNEPLTNDSPWNQPGQGPSTKERAAQQQLLEVGLNAVASMEVALQSLIDRGIADPDKTGICGYSRGAQVAEYAITQSHLFKAGSEGDGGGFEAGTFWSFGVKVYRDLSRQWFGGSPFNPAAIENYRRLAPSARVSEFSGPLLQQLAMPTAPLALEIHELLIEAGVPTELALFPQEAHIFWQPRHRRFAMERNLDWFNYWLLGRRDGDPAKTEQYQRWDRMARLWRGVSGAHDKITD